MSQMWDNYFVTQNKCFFFVYSFKVIVLYIIIIILFGIHVYQWGYTLYIWTTLASKQS